MDANRVQLTTDGHKAYLEAAEGAFGADVDYAQLVKLYGPTITAPGRYSPAECTGIKKIRREGAPDIARVSTSYLERQNLTMRMSMRRFTRLANGFSKKPENHVHALALYFAFYNFCRIHETLRVSQQWQRALLIGCGRWRMSWRGLTRLRRSLLSVAPIRSGRRLDVLPDAARPPHRNWRCTCCRRDNLDRGSCPSGRRTWISRAKFKLRHYPKAQLIARLNPRWLVGIWISSTADPSNCADDRALTFNPNHVFSTQGNTGRWALDADQLHLIGGGGPFGAVNDTSTITQADEESFTSIGSDGQPVSWRRCARAETDPPSIPQPAASTTGTEPAPNQ